MGGQVSWLDRVWVCNVDDVDVLAGVESVVEVGCLDRECEVRG
jgi:hypothetical protein